MFYCSYYFILFSWLIVAVVGKSNAVQTFDERYGVEDPLNRPQTAPLIDLLNRTTGWPQTPEEAVFFAWEHDITSAGDGAEVVQTLKESFQQMPDPEGHVRALQTVVRDLQYVENREGYFTALMKLARCSAGATGRRNSLESCSFDLSDRSTSSSPEVTDTRSDLLDAMCMPTGDTPNAQSADALLMPFPDLIDLSEMPVLQPQRVDADEENDHSEAQSQLSSPRPQPPVAQPLTLIDAPFAPVNESPPIDEVAYLEQILPQIERVAAAQKTQEIVQPTS